MILRTAAAFLQAFRFSALSVLFALLAFAAIGHAQPFSNPGSTAPYRPADTPTVAYTVAGTWIDNFGYTWTLTQDGSGIISGSVDLTGSGCPCGKGNCTGEGKDHIWPVSGALTDFSFNLYALNPATGNVCTSYVEYQMDLGVDSTTPITVGSLNGVNATGTYQYAAGGGSATMKLTTTCAMLLTNTLTTSTSNAGTTVNGSFQPAVDGAKYTLSAAAQLCGFVGFDWIQTVTHMPSPSPYYENNISDPAAPINLTGAYVPFHDPPPWGYTNVPGWLSYPFLFDPSSSSTGQPWSLSKWADDGNGVLTFTDSPADPCIPTASGAPSVAYTTNPADRTLCGNTTTAVGEFIGFTTGVAGINSDGSAFDLGLALNWNSNFNGTFSGGPATASIGSVDPGSGTGGITITGVTIGAPVSPNPAITPGGIISADAFGAFRAVAPGSWIEIYGANMAAHSRSWTSADFNGNTAPTSLDGTKVTVGGQPAFIDYISPGQVNAQVPSNAGTGPQPVVVSSADGTSASVTVTVNLEEPGLLAPPSFNIGGKQYVVARFPDGATYVLPPGAISGVTSRRAQPGDIITLYGVGFGSVTPNIPAGQIVQQLNTLAAPFHILFGQTEASLQYDGLAPSAIGLYQFNVTVPNVTASDAVPVTFTLADVAGTQTLYIAVQN
jgi:uncharacterized protein (TIGR03437 family)